LVHISWAEDRTADSGIRQYLKAVSIFGPGRPLAKTVPMVAANTVMSRLLKTNGLLLCDAELFDKVVSTLPWVHASKWASGKDYAQLLLYHPTRPIPRPFFKMTYETYHGDNPDNHDHTLKRQRAQDAMGTQILRAAYLSRLYGDNHHTEYLERIVQAHFKHNWRARAKVFANYSEDPELKHLVEAAERAGRDTKLHGADEIQ